LPQQRWFDAGVLSAGAMSRGRHAQPQRAAGRTVAYRRAGTRLPGAAEQLWTAGQRGGVLVQLHGGAEDFGGGGLSDGVAEGADASAGLDTERFDEHDRR